MEPRQFKCQIIRVLQFHLQFAFLLIFLLFIIILLLQFLTIPHFLVIALALHHAPMGSKFATPGLIFSFLHSSLIYYYLVRPCLVYSILHFKVMILLLLVISSPTHSNFLRLSPTKKLPFVSI